MGEHKQKNPATLEAHLIEEAVKRILVPLGWRGNSVDYEDKAPFMRGVLRDMLDRLDAALGEKREPPDMVAAEKERGGMVFCCPHCFTVSPPHGFAFAQFGIAGIGKGVVCTVFCGVPECRRIISTQVLDFEAAIARPGDSRIHL